MDEQLSRRAVVQGVAGIAATLPIAWMVWAEPVAAQPASPAEQPTAYTPPVPFGRDGKALSGEELARWEEMMRLPGVAYFEVSLFADDDPNYTAIGMDGVRRPSGQTLTEWRQQHGGDVGEMTHSHTGQTFRIDLSPYRHLDPDRTRVRVVTGFSYDLRAQRDLPRRPPEPYDPREVIRLTHVSPADIRNRVGVKPHLAQGLPAGRVTLQVSAVHRDDLGSLLNQRRGDTGHSVAEYRDALGGDEGDITDPFFGGAYRLSLAAYTHTDPEATYLRVRFIFTPDGHEQVRARFGRAQTS